MADWIVNEESAMTVRSKLNTLYNTVENKANKSTITTATLSAATWVGSSVPYSYTLSVTIS